MTPTCGDRWRAEAGRTPRVALTSADSPHTTPIRYGRRQLRKKKK